VTNEVADSMSRLCRNNMKDAPREFSEEVIFSANIIEKFTLTKGQYRTILSVHNSNVCHFGLDRTLKRLNSVLKIPIHAHGFSTSTYTPIETSSSDRFQTTDTSL
jgi:hypothetical protein